MESAQEEAVGSNSSDSGEYVNNVHGAGEVVVVKRKRTKRQRMTTSQAHLLQASVVDSSSASSAEAASGSVTEEEEDMANCLILLAQGRAFEDAVTKPESAAGEAPAVVGGGGGGGGCGGGGNEKFISRRFAETATTSNGKAGYYVYECKTCNKCFPSFQALGGHRASHKKPKLTLGIPTTMTAGGGVNRKDAVDEDMLQISMNSFAKQMDAVEGSHLTAGAVKPRIHECSICGAEFNSGQALGGHMRRHRPLSIQDRGSNIQEAIKKVDKNVLTLDLNLPAPSDVDDRTAQEHQRPPSPAFSLNSKRPLFLSPSASALVVDCHY